MTVDWSTIKEVKDIMDNEDYIGGLHIVVSYGGTVPKKIKVDLRYDNNAREYAEEIIRTFFIWADMVTGKQEEE